MVQYIPFSSAFTSSLMRSRRSGSVGSPLEEGMAGLLGWLDVEGASESVLQYVYTVQVEQVDTGGVSSSLSVESQGRTVSSECIGVPYTCGGHQHRYRT